MLAKFIAIYYIMQSIFFANQKQEPIKPPVYPQKPNLEPIKTPKIDLRLELNKTLWDTSIFCSYIFHILQDVQLIASKEADASESDDTINSSDEIPDPPVSIFESWDLGKPFM